MNSLEPSLRTPPALGTTDKPHIPMGATGQAGHRFQSFGSSFLPERALKPDMGGHICGGAPQNKIARSPQMNSTITTDWRRKLRARLQFGCISHLWESCFSKRIFQARITHYIRPYTSHQIYSPRTCETSSHPRYGRNASPNACAQSNLWFLDKRHHGWPQESYHTSENTPR